MIRKEGVNIMKTKIILDYTKSPYKFSINRYDFIFSSETNKRKFKEQLKGYIEKETLKIKDRYSQLNIDFEIFLVVSLYKRIEKRFFCVKFNDIDLKPSTLFMTSFVDDEAIHF